MQKKHGPATVFGKMLKSLREGSDLTMEEFCESFNKKFDARLNKSTVSRYENNTQEPMLSVVKNIALFFHVEPSYLIDGSVHTEPETKLVAEKSYQYGTKPSPSEKNEKNGHLKNIFTTEKLPLPHKLQNIDETPEKTPGSLMSVLENNADLFIYAKGDNMANIRINDGDIVLIKKQSTINSGEIAAVLIEDEIVMKRVYIKNKNFILMDEKNKHQPVILTEKEARELKIIGKAVAFYSSVK